jgi:ATP-dependent RNA helicase DeaD
MSKAVAAIAGKYMTDPEEAVVGHRNAGAESVSHECYKVHARDRYLALRRILDFQRNVYGIVFCRTRAETQEVAAKLMRDGYSADALHGEMMQEQRDAVMKRFRARELQLLVATDVAARGLDVTHLTHVINYNLPDEPEAYTHRSGRTGRAGKAGTSIVIVNLREEFKLRTIEQIIKRKFTHKSVPGVREVCESQLLGLAERLKAVAVEQPLLDSLLPVLTAALAEMPPAELLKRVALLECGRFLADEKDLSDVPPGGGHPAPEAGEGLVGLEINLGRRNGLTPAGLISVINRATRGPMVRLGRIQIREQTSMFEVPAEAVPALEASLSRTVFEGRRVGVRITPGDVLESRPPHARFKRGHRQ